MHNLFSSFSSSYYSEKTEFFLEYKTLSVVHLPADKIFDSLILILVDKTGKEYMNKVVNRFNKYIKLPTLLDGIYILNVYRHSLEKEGLYVSHLYNNIFIVSQNSICGFSFPKTLQSNSNFLKLIDVSKDKLHVYTKPSYAIQSYDSELIHKAKEITKFSHNNYHRLLAIHNWAARNLYYDYDLLINDAYKYSKINATSVLTSGKSVCQGYTEITIAFMRALNIPAIGVHCYALGDNPCGWENPMNMKNESNHIFTMAWVEGRWVIMDCTWDSPNKYEKNKFLKIETNGIFTKYFDPSLLLISSTHRFVKVFI